MNDVTLRDLINIITGLLVLVTTVGDAYLYAVRPHFRAYILPSLLLLTDSAAFFTVLILDILGVLPVPGYALMDWMAILRLHTYITVAIYVVWMPLLRR